MKKLVVSTLALTGIGLAAGYVYGAVIDKAEYASTSRLMVRDPRTSNQAKDYASIATSSSVLNYAKTDIGASEDLEDLKRHIKAVNLSGTNIIDISVATSDAVMSKKLNQAIIRGVKIQAELLYQKNNLIDVDPASEPRQVYKPNPLLSSLIGGGFGLLAGATLFFVLYPPNTSSRNLKDRAHALLEDVEPEPQPDLTVSPAPSSQVRAALPRRIDGVAARKSKFIESQDDKELDEILKNLEEKAKKP